MTIQEFKAHIEEELRHKLRGNNEATPILDRLDKHVTDFDGYDLTDLLNPKNMKHDLYVSFLFQICFPSRIRMEIDAEYTPIKKKRIAIVSCKSQKQDYPCSADEMYSPSAAFKAQREFFIKGYDDYYIMSSKYGLIHHSQIIKPYNRMVGESSMITKNQDQIRGWEMEVISLITEQIKWMISKGYEIDIHASRNYYNPLPQEIKDKINYIKQPQGVNNVKPRYDQAIEMLDTKPLKECLESIGRKSEKPKESKRWWYHPNYKPFYGTTTMLFGYYNKKGLKLNSGNLSKIHAGEMKQAAGWVIDKSLLNRLYQTDSGQWRIKK